MPDKSYEDMLDMPHPVSKKHPRMSMEDRAAQFAPFAALTGYEEAIDGAGMADIAAKLQDGYIQDEDIYDEDEKRDSLF